MGGNRALNGRNFARFKSDARRSGYSLSDVSRSYVRSTCYFVRRGLHICRFSAGPARHSSVRCTVDRCISNVGPRLCRGLTSKESNFLLSRMDFRRSVEGTRRRLRGVVIWPICFGLRSKEATVRLLPSAIFEVRPVIFLPVFLLAKA